MLFRNNADVLQYGGAFKHYDEFNDDVYRHSIFLRYNVYGHYIRYSFKYQNNCNDAGIRLSASGMLQGNFRGYRPIAGLSFAIGTAYQFGLLKLMVGVVFKDISVMPEYNFDIKAFIITLISFTVLYELIMYLYSKRIKKISVKQLMLE